MGVPNGFSDRCDNESTLANQFIKLVLHGLLKFLGESMLLNVPISMWRWRKRTLMKSLLFGGDINKSFSNLLLGID